MTRVVHWLLALLTLVSAPALAITYPPPPAGPIFDQADLLPPDREAALDAQLCALSAKTGKTLIIATVNSLEGETVNIYAVKLFEAWGIGGKESDSGLLLLVAPNERKVRIEVGYGLHGYVTDGLSGRIIREEITPLFKQKDMAGGIEAGVRALTEQLNRSPQDAKAIAEAAQAARAQGQTHKISAGGVIMAVIIAGGIVVIIIVFAARASTRGGRHYQRDDGGISPIVIWAASEALNAAMRGGHRDNGWGGGGGWGGGSDGGGFGGFGGGGSGGGGASGDW